MALPQVQDAPRSDDWTDVDHAVFDVIKYAGFADKEEFAYFLVELLAILRKRPTAKIGPRSSLEQRNEMLNAFAASRIVFRKKLVEAGYDELMVERGLTAANCLIVIWAESDRERAGRHPHFLEDLLDMAGILRNAARSIQMRRQIDERARARYDDPVRLNLFSAFGDYFG